MCLMLVEGVYNVSHPGGIGLKLLMVVRVGTVRDQERTSLKVQSHWQLNAQDWKGHAKRCGTLRRFCEK